MRHEQTVYHINNSHNARLSYSNYSAVSFGHYSPRRAIQSVHVASIIAVQCAHAIPAGLHCLRGDAFGFNEYQTNKLSSLSFRMNIKSVHTSIRCK